jgi:hypothetical protein
VATKPRQWLTAPQFEAKKRPLSTLPPLRVRPFKRRFTHALICPVAHYSEVSGRAINWFSLPTSLATNCLNNAYYPKEESGARKTISSAGIRIPNSAVGHLANVFGPDPKEKLIRKETASQV